MLDRIKQRAGVLGALVTTFMLGAFIAAGSASATVADPVDQAFTDMQGKVTTYGAAIVALVVVAAGIFLGVKYLKKGLSKA